MQFIKAISLLAIFCSSSPVLSFVSYDEQRHKNSERGENVKSEIKEAIHHHLKDAHSFHILTDKKTGVHYGFPLPIILWDKGLHVFMSSEFHHEKTVVESRGNYYCLYQNKIYKTDSSGKLIMDHHRRPTNVKPLDFSITKNVFSIILISLLIFCVFRKTANSYKKGLAPSGISKFLEPLVLFVRDEIAIPNIGEKYHRKYMGYLLTVFFFIWFTNLVGLAPLSINVTGNIAVTFALSFMTFLITQFTAKGEYWRHIFWTPGIPVPMKLVLAPIELLGIFIKPFALMIRLFANMSAGHLILMSSIGLLYIFQSWFARAAFLGLSLFLSVIELLVAFLQAYIFTMLTALYFGNAVAEHNGH